jgi:hypothetical protein
MRSALANRKMFRGGGMVPMGNPMANMQPMGILASSQPLVDAVASDILNPQGGSTLSMADGGIARLQRGGSAFMIGEAPSALQYVHPFEEIIANPLPEIVSDVPGAGLPAYMGNIIEGGDVTAFQEPGPVKRKDDEGITEFLPGELTLEEAMEPGFDSTELLGSPPMDTELPYQWMDPLAPEPTAEQLTDTDDTVTQLDVMRQDPAYQAAIDAQKKILSDAQDDGTQAYDTAVRELLGNDNYSQEFKDDVLGTYGAELAQAELAQADKDIPKGLQRLRETGEVTDDAVVTPVYTKELAPLTNWLSANEVTSTEEIPSSILSQSVDAIINRSIEALQGKTFDKRAFKAELESLLPAVEEDPETEGLLLTMLGASILAGKDKDWAVNVGKGLEKSLPSFINFKNKKKEDERSRQMTIAKLTIEEGLRRDSDIRKAVRTLEQSRTASQISEAQRLLTPTDWWISESVLIPAESIGLGEGDPDVFLPQGTTLSLNELSRNKLAGLGVKALPFDKGSWKIADFMTAQDLISHAEHVQAMNSYGDRVSVKVFEKFGRPGMNINYITSTPGSLLADGMTKNMINESNLDAFMSEYFATRQPAINLRNDVRDILNIVLEDPEKFVGAGQLLDQWTDVARGAFGAGSAPVKFLEGLGATTGLGAAREAEVKSIIVLAKIAPILLDESGKTISDNDRKMIANTLGLGIVWNDPGDESKGFRVQMTPAIFDNPQAIALAIRQTEEALNRRLNAINNEARTHLNMFGIPASAEEMIGIEKQQRAQIEQLRETEETVEFGPTWDRPPEETTFDFDLT